jgi:hemolysin-activating ACP:hemolysin acyltransferase
VALPPTTITDLGDLLKNVERGNKLCDLHGEIMQLIFHPDHAGWRVANLRRKLLPKLTEMRVLAAAIAGQA